MHSHSHIPPANDPWWLRHPVQKCLALLVCLLPFVPLGGQASSRFERGDATSNGFYPILPWDPLHGWSYPGTRPPGGGLEDVAACGFNCAGFVFPEDLPQCERLGLSALLLPLDKSFTNFNFMLEWRKLSDEQIEQRVRSMVRAGGKSPAVVGYFIMDEPGAQDFPALAKAVAAVRKYAPGKLAYINLFPDYATLGAPNLSQLGTSSYTEYLERFASEVRPQLLSYDNYQVQYSGDLKDRAKGADYYRNLLEVRRVAQEHKLPCLNIVAANQQIPGMPVPSPANLALQAYTTLAAGYRGVTWYSFFGPGYKYTAIDPGGRRTLTWTYLRTVNTQIAALAPTLSQLSSAGVFFSKPAPADDLPLLPGRLVQEVSCPAPVMVGEFAGRNGETYVMIVNLSLEASARFTVKAADWVRSIEVVSPVESGMSEFDPKAGLWLCAGNGALLRLNR
jgi:hypothetical protein